MIATIERQQSAASFDVKLQIGQVVEVRWGWGSGFRASGRGQITGLFRTCVWVRLLEAVPDPANPERQGWPKGFVLKGIPRFPHPNWTGKNGVFSTNGGGNATHTLDA